MRISVIGIGNDARGDDAVGLVTARRLQREAADGVNVQEVHGDGTHLLDEWRGVDAAILIDACVSGAAPGAIHRLEPLRQPLSSGVFACSTHAFGVAEAIELARALQQLPPQLVVYGIEARQFSIGRELSADVRRAVPKVVQQVQQDIHALQAQCKGVHHA